MLSPVTDHQPQPHDYQRQYKDESRGLRVQLEHGVLEDIRPQLPESLPCCHAVPPLADKVRRQIQPNKKEKLAHVVQEVQHAVPLIADSGALVIGPVALDVVVLDVVVEVAVPGVAHERVQQVGEGGVEPGVALVQHAPAVDVLVHHERVGARVRDLHDDVQDAVEPGEVAEQQQG